MRENDIYAPMASGLGDILMYYLSGDIGYFVDWKRRHPEARTKVLAVTVSDQIPALFRDFPNMDELEVRRWAREHERLDGSTTYPAEGFRLLSDEERSHVEYNRPGFNLSAEERVIAEDFARGDYVVVHPFAGDHLRSFQDYVNTPAIVRALCEHHRVVVIGGDSERFDRGVHLKEEAPLIAHPNLTSLVNVGSVRLHAHLTKHATAFVGSVSAYNCVAQSCKVPSFILAPPHLRSFIRADGHGIFSMIRLNRSQVRYWDDPQAGLYTVIRDWSEPIRKGKA